MSPAPLLVAATSFLFLLPGAAALACPPQPGAAYTQACVETLRQEAYRRGAEAGCASAGGTFALVGGLPTCTPPTLDQFIQLISNPGSMMRKIPQQRRPDARAPRLEAPSSGVFQ